MTWLLAIMSMRTAERNLLIMINPVLYTQMGPHSHKSVKYLMKKRHIPEYMP